MKKIIRIYGILALIASTIIILDQWTKGLVRDNLPFGAVWFPVSRLAPFVRIVHWENTGAAFGLFQGWGMLFAVMAVVVTVFIVVYYPQIPQEENLMRIALAMQLGGALGNLIDRIRFGPVTDFIAIGGFPVFNVADASITVGVGVLILALWLSERKEKQRLMSVTKFEDINSKTIDSET